VTLAEASERCKILASRGLAAHIHTLRAALPPLVSAMVATVCGVAREHDELDIAARHCRAIYALSEMQRLHMLLLAPYRPYHD